MAKKRWNILSPDGFAINPEKTYASKKEGLAEFEKWKERYRQQGYYSSTRYGRIGVDDLVRYCRWCEAGKEIEAFK